MRRLILEDPFARSAIWSRNLAFFAVIVAAIGVLLARKGLDPKAALAIEASALCFAGLAVFFAFVAMAVIWRTGFRGLGLALAGLGLSLLLFAYPTFIAVEARTVTGVADVSTDLADPPVFMTSAKAVAARRGYTPPPTMDAADRKLDAKLYPDLQTLTLDAEASDVEDALHKLIKRRKWEIADETAPANFQTGHIDCVVKTAVLGFPADVTIRVRSLGAKTTVDIRSVMRTPWQERPGSNAARVQDLAEDLDDAVSES